MQFGLDYGVSNSVGRPSEGEVAAILARAIETRIGYLDTAPAYGDAEMLIGRHLPRGHGLRIVTKLRPIVEETISVWHGTAVLETLARSLDHLNADKVYGILVHRAADLAKPGAEHIVEALMQARARGWVERIGASVYDCEQLSLVESRFQPQLVQLPFNALDHRPIGTGMLSRLRAQGAEIHARSIFLQGLLLMEPNELPQFFAPIRAQIAGLQQYWSRAGLSALGGCLQFVLRRSDVDVVIVGVNHLPEFNDIVGAVRQDGDAYLNEPVVAIDPLYLDASRWPTFTH